MRGSTRRAVVAGLLVLTAASAGSSSWLVPGGSAAGASAIPDDADIEQVVQEYRQVLAAGATSTPAAPAMISSVRITPDAAHGRGQDIATIRACLAALERSGLPGYARAGLSDRLASSTRDGDSMAALVHDTTRVFWSRSEPRGP